MKVILKNEIYANEFILYDKINIENNINFNEKNVVILGNFDGVHLGHLEIIKTAVNKAKILNLKTVLYTFREYPKKRDSLITTLSEKLHILKDLNIDYIYFEEFEDIKDFDTNDFVEKILINKLNATEIFCGFNYTFGKNKKGDIFMLEKILSKRANLNIMQPVLYNLNDNKIKIVKLNKLKNYLDKGYFIISSTFIKTFIENGNMDVVNKLLGHRYMLMGEVIHGKKIARTLGYPTVNISNTNKKYPLFGVYGVIAKIQDDNKIYYGIMNIGKNPTMENEGIHIETHIIDFEKDIYGKIICIEVIENIRLEKKMESLIELKNQISRDKIIWREKIDEYKFND